MHAFKIPESHLSKGNLPGFYAVGILYTSALMPSVFGISVLLLSASSGTTNLLMAVTATSGMTNKSTGGLMNLRMELKFLSKDKSVYSIFQVNRT